MTTADLHAALTDAQRVAAEHVDGPLLILAGPGSGKTRVVTHRIAHLLAQGVPPHAVLALTFTNKAADEMAARVQTLAPGQRVWMGTFHRFCARLLRRYAPHVGLSENYTIYDTQDSRRALKRAIEAAEVDLTHITADRIAAAVSWTKNNLISAEDYQPQPGSPLGEVMGRVYPAYQQGLRRANAVDFDDLLLHVARLLKENPPLRAQLDERYRYILVDEYQDTNLAQYAIVRALSIDHPNLAVTGDPDQSIYGWRGANIGNILEFERDYPDVKVVRLEQNYRSTRCILEVADALISNNKRRKKKRLFTRNDAGRPVRLIHYPTHRDEAEAIADRIAADIRTGRRKARDFAVFYRVNALSRTFEFLFRERAIPYQIVHGVEFFQRKEIKEVLSYLQLINNPADDVALLRVINTPPRGIGKTTLERLNQHALRYRVTLLEAAREAGLIDSLNKRAAVAVAKFVALYDRLAESAAEPVEAVLGHVLMQSGYRDQLQQSDSDEDQQRLENIEELLTVAREFDRQTPEGGYLEAFLEQVSLVNDTDDWEEQNDRVTLMTLHAAKGLEFPVVFIVATEEGLLPHERSRQDPQQLEEERRLFFVGITRAEEELEISLSMHREFRGGNRYSVPSQFLMELPREQMEVVQPSRRADPDDWESEAEFHDQWDEPPAADQHPAAAGAASQAVPATVAPAGKMITAAQMLGEPDAPVQQKPIDPEAFTLAMIVSHPKYGLGKIIALGGSREKRTATVQFIGPAGECKFRLAHSPLRPAKAD